MNSLIHMINKAFKDGLVIEVEMDKLAVTGPKPVIQKYAAFIRENRDAILDFLSPDPVDSVLAAIAEADRLINRLCDEKGRSPEHRAAMLKARREMAPAHLHDEIETLKTMIDRREAA